MPLVNRGIPIIFDEYVEMDFGTGALKITPAHDPNDYTLGKKHNLETINILNTDGTLNENAKFFVGDDRFVARKKAVEALKESGNFVKQEDYKNQVGHSERTNAVVEPRLSMQWWCNMQELAKPALKVVEEADIRFVPEKFKNVYRHWMENIRDWAISRQLWWGHRIPAWQDMETGKFYVAETEEAAIEQWKEAVGVKAESVLKDNPHPLQQESDVLDTWFSSWLWPMGVFGWDGVHPNAELDYYYPTSVLVTGPDIIFFWVARMIMAGMEYKKQIPFKNVYFTGIVRDKQGRKMSKQLGNSPDLLKMIDEHGADVVRFSVLISSPAGNDILFDEAFLEQGRNFINKMWNALKLVKMWEPRQEDKPAEEVSFAINWMRNRIAQVSEEIEDLFKDYRLSESLKTIYSLIWNDFCSWYLEWVKPGFEEGISKDVYAATIEFFEDLLQLLHPFMPFATEEMYHLLKHQKEDLMVKQLPQLPKANAAILKQATLLQNIITAVRDARNKNHLKNKDSVQLFVDTLDASFYEETNALLAKQVNAQISMTQQPIEGSTAIVVDTEKIYMVSENGVSNEDQIAELTKELDYMKGFLTSVEKKLGNERFVANAKPEIVDNERKKQADAIAKIKVLEESISLLK